MGYMCSDLILVVKICFFFHLLRLRCIFLQNPTIRSSSTPFHHNNKSPITDQTYGTDRGSITFRANCSPVFGHATQILQVDCPQNETAVLKKGYVIKHSRAPTNTGNHSKQDQKLLAKIGKYIGFRVYRRSCLPWFPVIDPPRPAVCSSSTDMYPVHGFPFVSEVFFFRESYE